MKYNKQNFTASQLYAQVLVCTGDVMDYTWLNAAATTYADLPAVSISSETYQSVMATTYGHGNIFTWAAVDSCSNDICIGGFSTSSFTIGSLI